jgi:hypothetical protein
MARFTVEFDCDNAAFGDSPIERLDEVARILHALGDHLENIEQGYPLGSVRDVNGNVVGRWSLSE